MSRFPPRVDGLSGRVLMQPCWSMLLPWYLARPCRGCVVYKMRTASFASVLSQLIKGDSSDDEAFSASPFNSPFISLVAVTDVVVSNWYFM